MQKGIYLFSLCSENTTMLVGYQLVRPCAKEIDLLLFALYVPRQFFMVVEIPSTMDLDTRYCFFS